MCLPDEGSWSHSALSPVQTMNPFDLPATRMFANARRWAVQALGRPAPCAPGANPSIRLVHRVAADRVDFVLQSGVLRSARALRVQDPDAPTRTFPMDEALGLDQAVFFTPGFVTEEISDGAGAALVLSAEASARILRATSTRWVAQDLADVLRIFRCTARDVRDQRDRFTEAVRVYLDHTFTGSGGAALQRALIQRRHGGDIRAWERWIRRCHQGRGFDHAAEAVERAWFRQGHLPMTPEVLAPGGFPLSQDPDLEVVRAPRGKLFEAVAARMA